VLGAIDAGSGSPAAREDTRRRDCAWVASRARRVSECTSYRDGGRYDMIRGKRTTDGKPRIRIWVGSCGRGQPRLFYREVELSLKNIQLYCQWTNQENDINAVGGALVHTTRSCLCWDIASR
jgi:hypothetical protein